MRVSLVALLVWGCAETGAPGLADTGGAPDADPGASARFSPRQLEEAVATFVPGAVFLGKLTRTSGIWDGRTHRWARLDCMYEWDLHTVQVLPPPRGCTSCVASFEVSRRTRTDVAWRVNPGTVSSCPGEFTRDGGLPQVLPDRVYTVTARPTLFTVGASGTVRWATDVVLVGGQVAWTKDF